MIKFKIEEKEYIVPEKITIDKYVKIYKIKDILTEEYFAAKLISIVCECPMEDLLESDYQEVNYIASHIMGLIPLGQPKFVDRFELDGVQYGFFPNWKDLSFAEFVDMDTISTKKEDELLDLLHILCSIMYRPIIKERSEHDFDIEKYDMKSMKLRAEVFKSKLDISIVLGAQFFFINYAKRYSDYFLLSLTPTFSIWTKIKLAWSLRRMIWSLLFKKHTGGSLSSTDLLTTILQNTTRSFKKTS
jgi:hypothetical protein